MRTETITIYQYDELPTDEAKRIAREWYDEGATDYEWWDFTYDDAKEAGLRISEFDLDHGTIKGRFDDPAKQVAESIVKNHGDSCETHKDAAAFLAALEAIDGAEDEVNQAEDLAQEFLHTLLEDYRIMLQHEYDYLHSTEQIEESIRANEYEFLESGERA
jgi:hypothetical protein